MWGCTRSSPSGPAHRHTGHALCPAFSPYADYSGPNLWSICSPSLLWNSPQGHSWPCPLSTASDLPSTTYNKVSALGWDNLKSLATRPKSAPASTLRSHQALSKSPTSRLPQVPNSGHSPGGSVPSHPNSLCPHSSRLVLLGRFSALIWVGLQASPEAHPGGGRRPALCPGLPPCQLGCLIQSRARNRVGPLKTSDNKDNHTLWESHGKDFQVPLLPSSFSSKFLPRFFPLIPSSLMETDEAPRKTGNSWEVEVNGYERK